MSKETDQVKTLLSVVIGSMIWFEIKKPFAKVEIQRAITATKTIAIFAKNNWGGFHNRDWCRDKYKEFMEAHGRDYSPRPAEVVLIAHRVVCDLLDIYTSGKRKLMLEDANKGLEKIIAHIGPETDDIHVLEAVGNKMSLLFEILEIDDDQYQKTRKAA